MTNPLERQIEVRLRDGIKSLGGLCLKWVCPGWAGVPDRIILLPGGHIIFAELKRPKGGTVGPLQEWWAKKLRAMGFVHFTIYTYADVAEVLRLASAWADLGGKNNA